MRMRRNWAIGLLLVLLVLAYYWFFMRSVNQVAVAPQPTATVPFKEPATAEDVFAGKLMPPFPPDVTQPVKVDVNVSGTINHTGDIILRHTGGIKVTKKVVAEKRVHVSQKPRAQAPPPAPAPSPIVALPAAAPVIQPPPAPKICANRPTLPTPPIGPCQVKYGPEYKVRVIGEAPRPVVEWAIVGAKRTQRIYDSAKCEVIERFDDGAGFVRERIRDDAKNVIIERIRKPDGHISEKIRDERSGATINRFEDGSYLVTLTEDDKGPRELRVPISEAKPEQRARPPKPPAPSTIG